jgi:copper(I)-binding protein
MKPFLVVALLFAAAPVFAQVEIEQPWSRATPPGAKLAAGYMTLRNKSASPDRLVGGSSPLAARLETHVTSREGDIMKMRPTKGYDIPAGGSFELKPSGAHLMFVDIKRPFKEGDRIPATLRFEKAGEVKVEFRVMRSAPGAALQHGH